MGCACWVIAIEGRFSATCALNVDLIARILYTDLVHRIDAMPTLLRVGPYRFFIYSADCEEPSHIHVERDNNVAKFWLTPVRLQSSGGFKRSEINRIYRVIDDHIDELIRGWHDCCND